MAKNTYRAEFCVRFFFPLEKIEVYQDFVTSREDFDLSRLESRLKVLLSNSVPTAVNVEVLGGWIPAGAPFSRPSDSADALYKDIILLLVGQLSNRLIVYEKK